MKLGLLILLAQAALAHLPDYHMIMSRTAETHGRGTYQIEQDVVFRGDPDPLVIHETWWINGEQAMRVNFEGRGGLKGQVQGAILYDSNQKHWRDDSGKLKSSRLQEEWIESLFHFRFSKNIKPRLVTLKIAPPESLKERSLHFAPGEKDASAAYKYSPQNFMRLSRTGGTLAYAIGTPTPPSETQAYPGIWIEQDQFVIRKIRLPSQALITAGDYARFPQNLWLSRTRSISWGQHSVQIHVGSVKHLGKLNPKSEILKTSGLDVKKNPEVAVRLPESDLIREFYTRFR